MSGKPLHSSIDVELHRGFKATAAEQGRSIKDSVQRAIRLYLDKATAANG